MKAEWLSFLLMLVLGLMVQAFAFAAEPRSIASISDANGVVMVDQGKGFRSSRIGAELFENDRVITLDGSMAEITFNDGCRTKLNANNLIVVNSAERCLARITDAARTTNIAAAKPGSILIPAGMVGAVVGGIILLQSISDE